jgi:tether containing UBX domain for GLUT4
MIDSTKDVAGADVPTTSTLSTKIELPDPSTYKVYRPPDGSVSSKQITEIPATYFEATSADIRAAQDSLHARTEALVNAPFRTREIREAAEKAKADKYPTATIRVKFSDRTQLEKGFPSSNKIKSVYEFVRSLLREDVKPTKFILYQTPPPRELKISDPKVRDLSLLQLQLVPTAMLHVKFLDESLNHNDVQAPLVPSILATAINLPLPPSLNELDDNPRSHNGRIGSTSTRSSITTQKRKPGSSGLSIDEAQKKIGKLFKGLGPKT